MKCEDVQINLNRFIDNELNADSCLIISEHLVECEQCLHQVKSIQNIKQQLVSLEVPPLSDDFTIKLQGRINRDHYKGSLRKLLPIAASIALIVPLTYLLTNKPPAKVQNDFVSELISAGNSTNNDYENFHMWTQIDDAKEHLVCDNSKTTNYCSLDFTYIPRA